MVFIRGGGGFAGGYEREDTISFHSKYRYQDLMLMDVLAHVEELIIFRNRCIKNRTNDDNCG